MDYVPLDRTRCISQIRNKSKKLGQFFDQIPDNIKNKIFCQKKVNSSGNSNLMRNKSHRNGNHDIIFDNDNIADVRDSIIAHELTHILLREESFPFIGPKSYLIREENYEKLMSQFNNLLQHRLVYPRLIENNFNVVPDFRDVYLQYFMRGVGYYGTNNRNNRPLIRNQYIGTILEKVLIFWFTDYNLIKNFLSQNEGRSFGQFLKRYYVYVSRESSQLLNIFDDIGYDTPDKQNELIEILMERYGLQGYFKICEIINGSIEIINE